jgi:hypothetical protein
MFLTIGDQFGIHTFSNRHCSTTVKTVHVMQHSSDDHSVSFFQEDEKGHFTLDKIQVISCPSVVPLNHKVKKVVPILN